ADGVWAREAEAAIYPYQQTYTVAGRPVTRTGFIALGEVRDYAAGVVLPHERTHAGPKRDRMALLAATGADVGLLFMLVSDPAGDLRRATVPAGEPIAEARDLQGEVHRLWRVTHPAAPAAPRPSTAMRGAAPRAGGSTWRRSRIRSASIPRTARSAWSPGVTPRCCA